MTNNYRAWLAVYKERPAPKKKPTLNSYPPELRGPSQNRFGGQKTQGLRTYGGPFGAAGPVRHYSRTECRAVEDDLRKRGVI